tara:strand:- start:102 stop:275 length:174 start_codon:yes stop_codon:yes gene_type:complete
LDNHLNTYDDFVDDLLSSDVNLLKGELDFLLFQHLFLSFDLKKIKNTESQMDDNIAA